MALEIPGHHQLNAMQVAAYDKTQGKMAFFDASRPQDFVFISGTKVIFSKQVLPKYFVIVTEKSVAESIYVSYLNKTCVHFTDADACKEQREPA